MMGFALKRIATNLVVLLLVSILAFYLMALVPGDPAAALAGVGASAAEIEAIRDQLGLDRPLPERITSWLIRLLHGDLGDSITLGQPVLDIIGQRLPATLSLSLMAMTWTIIFGVGGGIVAAKYSGTWIDRSIMTTAVLGVSMPNFWLGFLLIMIFGVGLLWFPTGGYVTLSDSPSQWFRHLLLPSIALSFLQIALLARMTRGALLDVLGQDYIHMAKARGLTKSQIFFKYALLNAAIPIVTVIGNTLSLMLSGAVIVESVFSIPGIGELMASSILSRDYPIIQGALIVTAAMFVTINLLMDLAYAWLNPKVRYE
tara:strand:+ start:1078 stop:2022 length:945 start_codon:yes stop_codon:yes gene_type:complete